MKRFLKASLFLAIVLSPFLKGNAQEFEGFIDGGLTISQIDGENLSGFSKFGFYLGPGVTYPLTDKSNLGIELLYTQKGSSKDNEEVIASPNSQWRKARFDYIDVPLFWQLEVDEEVFLHFGLNGGVLINASSPSFDIDAGDYNRLNLGGIIGGSYQIDETWDLTARFNYSLFPFDQTSSRPIFAFRSVGLFHSNILFGVNYSLGR